MRQQHDLRRDYSAVPLILLCALFLVGVLGVLIPQVWAQDTETVRYFDRSVAHVRSGSTDVDVSAADWTSPQVVLEFDGGNEAAKDVQVTFDLSGGGNGNADSFSGGYTTETIQFFVARKIQGNWRYDLEDASSTVTGNNADNHSITLSVSHVAPTEDLRIYVELSAEQSDLELPYVLYYRAPNEATFTEQTAG